MPAEVPEGMAWRSRPQAGLGAVTRWTILTDDTNKAGFWEGKSAPGGVSGAPRRLAEVG